MNFFKKSIDIITINKKILYLLIFTRFSVILI